MLSAKIIVSKFATLDKKRHIIHFFNINFKIIVWWTWFFNPYTKKQVIIELFDAFPPINAVWLYKKHSIRNTSWIFQKIKKQLLADNLGLRNTDILAKIIFGIFWKKSVLNDWRINKKHVCTQNYYYKDIFLWQKGFYFF